MSLLTSVRQSAMDSFTKFEKIDTQPTTGIQGKNNFCLKILRRRATPAIHDEFDYEIRKGLTLTITGLKVPS